MNFDKEIRNTLLSIEKGTDANIALEQFSRTITNKLLYPIYKSIKNSIEVPIDNGREEYNRVVSELGRKE